MAKKSMIFCWIRDIIVKISLLIYLVAVNLKQKKS